MIRLERVMLLKSRRCRRSWVKMLTMFTLMIVIRLVFIGAISRFVIRLIGR